jgi:DUF2934 family protein
MQAQYMTSEPGSLANDAEREQLIREKAYQLWQVDGAPEGKSDHHWHRAGTLLEADGDDVGGGS